MNNFKLGPDGTDLHVKITLAARARRDWHGQEWIEGSLQEPRDPIEILDDGQGRRCVKPSTFVGTLTEGLYYLIGISV